MQVVDDPSTSPVRHQERRMDVGEVRVAEDKDFELLKIYLSRNDGWRLQYDKEETAVWTRPSEGSDFNMIRVSWLNFNLWIHA